MTYSYPGDAPDQSGSKIFNNLYDGSATFETGKLVPWLSIILNPRFRKLT